MKKCPFCAEEIQDEAIKCRFCNEFLDGSGNLKPNLNTRIKQSFFLKPSFLVFSFVCVGPLMLPLIWINKTFSLKKKIIITSVIVVISIFLGIATFNALKSLKSYYGDMMAMLN